MTLGCLCVAVVVEDDVDQLAGRSLTLDRAQEAQELLVPVALQTAADDRAVEDVERSEQRRRAVAFVIVGHRSALAGLQRQARLGAVERLDLALLSGDQGQHRPQAKSQLTESLQSGTPCKADLLVAINSYPAGLHRAETKIPHSRGWRGSRRTGPIFSGAAASRPGQISVTRSPWTGRDWPFCLAVVGQAATGSRW